MRLKDPFSLKAAAAADMTKRTNKPRRPRDEESSDEVSGTMSNSRSKVPLNHVSKAVDLSSVKKAVSGSLWSVCCDCLREKAAAAVGDAEAACPHDILVCLKCGFQGCNQSETQHSVKHHQALHSESHCITISLNTCFECNEELSTHCNKKALAQTLDFLQKHSVKATSGPSPKILKLREEAVDQGDLARGKSSGLLHSALAAVKGINNLGNTCFFNAVMQNLSQTHMLIDLIQELKEKGYKMRISPPAESNLSLLTVTLPSPEPLTSAMFLFLHTMKEPGKGPVSPKVLFNQLCQKAPRFKGYQQQDSQELLHYLLDSIRVEETKRVKASILKAFNNPTEKTADEETKRHVKAYGKEGVKLNFVDRIFVGELTNTIMCEECEHISTVKEAFIDISLPIIEERISKPSNPGRLSKSPREQEGHFLQAEALHAAAPSSLNRNTRKPAAQRQQARRSSGSVEEDGADREDEEVAPVAAGRPAVGGTVAFGCPLSRVTSAGSHSDSSDERLDSSNDADSEASESEWTPRPASRQGHAHPAPAPPPVPSAAASSPSPPLRPSPTASTPSPRQGGAVEQLFTSVELLMGNNKLLCDGCTERRQKQLRKSSSSDKKSEKVYTSARKQILISSLPPVAGMNLRKVNRHVDFPLVLDLAPFCSATCKNLACGGRVPYSLYGIVEHSGSMRGGHYTAYVRVRPPQRRGDPHHRRNMSQWVYVSDTTVQTVPESRVLNSQAYLLFYEEMP
ncbi:hypothetical protein CRUP_018893 [Coryphaenoides rupestris]|nr:hypothetical protein CRUP_018893 [Coryphaenoides rupestris]